MLSRASATPPIATLSKPSTDATIGTGRSTSRTYSRASFLDRRDQSIATIARHHAAQHNHLRIDQRDDLREPHRQEIGGLAGDLAPYGMIAKNIAQKIGLEP